ncbi:DUF6057 family protein [uncultured Bacteroides sp.]|uniref:DUF6057 family protein n=1 Tax=uncultured Bacteroides sp. TaxID=162156 RepID=UPI00261E15E1|nr:DUF6057 family protein [uncultured Bacteroides sp.]
MNLSVEKIGKTGLTLLLAITAFVFWNNYYPAHLLYHEQYQLFLFDGAYLWERLSVPEGFADYIAEFLTQFYYHPWMGALILSFLLTAIQLLCWALVKKFGTLYIYYPLSFIPVFVLWHYLADENAMLSLAVAILIVLIAGNLYFLIKNTRLRLIYALGCIPVLYWLAGTIVYVFIGWVVLSILIEAYRTRTYFSPLFCSLGLIAWGILIPLVTAYFLQYPLLRLLRGLEYYRFPEVFPNIIYAIGLLLVLIPVVSSLFPLWNKRIGVIIEVVLVACWGYNYVKSGCDFSKEESMKYDWMVREKQWNEIIRMAESKTPTSPYSVTCLNLALGMTGQMGDRMFEFYQNGTEGLLAKYQRDFTSPLPTSEAFYYLGMINTAQRFTFEAMEAIPNFRKSTRCFKRLAETNLINGQYQVAAKYLHALSKTLFYKDWAEETLGYLGNEKKINAHPEWGWLRKARYTEDFLFSDREMDMMLGLLYQHNYQNKLAFEYLLAYVMHQRDIDKFMRYYPLGAHSDYDHIPKHYQELLVYVWTQTHNSWKGMPWSIYPDVMRDIMDFAKIFSTQSNAREYLKQRYGQTYWNYLLLN